VYFVRLEVIAELLMVVVIVVVVGSTYLTGDYHRVCFIFTFCALEVCLE